ncbi:hypothetical protein NW768_006759 [Fusarium equiseti]|uniref:CBM-cenC domain-containing protein n=1 Tax=Fusarium equiseti TaxID=61235 RepID=A0ABQ8R965_FUSEQ|nr:hypothetical protein NW768_006759 [Fusarium equiseti]
MGCRSIFALAAVAASLFGVNAGPCKPATSTAVSVVQSDTSSTATSEAESTTLLDISLTLSTGTLSTDATSEILVETTPTTVIDSTSTQLVETTPTTLIESTSTNSIEGTATTSAIVTEETSATSAVLTEESSTTLAASTTTTEAEACTETQVIINPGFDDNPMWYPWTKDTGDTGIISLSNVVYYSAPYSMFVALFEGGRDATISQPLRNLKGRYLLSYRWKIDAAQSDQDFTCSVQPKIGNTFLQASNMNQISVPLVEVTEEWSTVEEVDSTEFTLVIGCSGILGVAQLNIDDITLNKVCDA